jgi:hypothetical protein
VPFSLDTSGLLDAWVRHYPPDVFPTIWTELDASSKRGEILVIDEVLRELERKDDEIYKWVKQRGEMIVPIDQQIQATVVRIMASHGRLVDSRKHRSVCDPWVIGLAQTRGLTVVTAEKATGSIARPKIPDVCLALGVPCIGLVEFFRQQGWRW